MVKCAAAGHGDQPPAGIGRQAVARPLGEGRFASILGRVLAQPEITRDASGRSGGRQPAVAERALDGIGQGRPAMTMRGRTSIAPYLADGILLTQRTASSRSAQSST